MSSQIAKLLFLLYLISLGYMQPSFRIDRFTIPPSDFIFVFVLGFWLVSLTEKTFKKDSSFVFLGLYFLAMLISLFFSDSLARSLIKIIGEAYLLLIPVLTVNLIESEEDFKKAIIAFISGSIIPVSLGIASIFLFYFDNQNPLLSFTTYSYGSAPVGYYPRIRSSFLTPSLLFNYLSLIFAILLIAKDNLLISRKTRLLFLFLILVVCTFTFSSGFGGLILTIGFWIYLNQKRSLLKKLTFFLSSLIAVLLYLMNFFAFHVHSTATFSYKILGLEFFPSARLLVWIDSTKTFLKSPFFGNGVGTDSCRVLFENTDGSFSLLTDAHNLFLSIATQTGIFGVLAILLIIIRVLKICFSSKHENYKYAFGIGFVSTFIYQGLTSAFEDSRHLWLLIGLVLTRKD